MQRIKRYLTPSRVLWIVAGVYAFIAFTSFVAGDRILADKYALALASLFIGWWIGQAEVQERLRTELRRRAHGDT